MVLKILPKDAPSENVEGDAEKTDNGGGVTKGTAAAIATAAALGMNTASSQDSDFDINELVLVVGSEFFLNFFKLVLAIW